jgi:hypothetical protein
MTTAGLILVVGFGVFMAGASVWKVGYQAPIEERMPLLHADRTRLRWIHWSMLVAMLLTPSGLFAAAAASGHPGAWAAAAVYAVGVVPWVLNLTFRLTVQERTAAAVAGGDPLPGWYEPIEQWAGLGHRFHMLASYGSAVLLAWGLAESRVISDWLAWAGAAWGVVWLCGLLVPRTRFAFEPPFWAHTFTLAVGIALI